MYKGKEQLSPSKRGELKGELAVGRPAGASVLCPFPIPWPEAVVCIFRTTAGYLQAGDLSSGFITAHKMTRASLWSQLRLRSAARPLRSCNPGPSALPLARAPSPSAGPCLVPPCPPVGLSIAREAEKSRVRPLIFAVGPTLSFPPSPVMRFLSRGSIVHPLIQAGRSSQHGSWARNADPSPCNSFKPP